MEDLDIEQVHIVGVDHSIVHPHHRSNKIDPRPRNHPDKHIGRHLSKHDCYSPICTLHSVLRLGIHIQYLFNEGEILFLIITFFSHYQCFLCLSQSKWCENLGLQDNEIISRLFGLDFIECHLSKLERLTSQVFAFFPPPDRKLISSDWDD